MQTQHRLENPKQTIIAKTQELIQKNSFNSVTFDNIAKELHIKKPSVIYHFRSKEELGLEVLKSYRNQIQTEISNLDRYTDEPLTKLKNYFRFFANIHRTVMGMCPAGVMTAEFNSLSKEMQKELKGFFSENFNWLIKILEEGKKQDKLGFPGQAKDRAYLIAGAIEGGLMFARMEGDSQIFWNILRQLKLGLEINETWTITPRDKSGTQVKI